MLKAILIILLATRIANCQETMFLRVSDIDNSVLADGEQCSLSGGRQGICKEITQCDSVKKLLVTKRTSEIVRCSFHGIKPLVCCPQSQKFIKALCENLKPIPLGLDFKITNGLKADVGEFPYQAALGRKNLENFLEFNCGGSLIADDIVLTAAHCLNKIKEAATMVRLGRTSLNLTDEFDDSTAEDIDIETFKLHPKYNSRSRQNDIALIKLKRPAKLSDNIKPICLSTDDKNIPTNLTITGYGSTQPGTSTKSSLSDWLLKGTVQSYPNDECTKMYKSLGKDLINSQYCANSVSGVDACQGDSGGALNYKKDGYYFQYGVISYGAGCGSPFPAIYTKVNQYLDWIGDEMLKFDGQ